jgi:hypothetical protein
MASEPIDSNTATGTNPRPQPATTIRVWGMAASGKPFIETGCLRAFTRSSAVISGLPELVLGDVIGIQCDDAKSRSQVIQIHDENVEIRLLADQACPWKNLLKGSGVQIPLERRQRNRHQTWLPIELTNPVTRMPMRVIATDVSGRGCYVQTMLPAAKGTRWLLGFWLDERKVEGECVVKTHDPAFGMGMEFSGLADDLQERLEKFLSAKATSSSLT